MRLLSLLDPGDWLAMRPQLDPKAPALDLDYRPARGEVKLRLIVGFAVTATVGVIGWFLRDEGIALFVLGGFALFGLLNILYGLLQSRFSLSMKISRLEVAVDRRTLWGRRAWRESLHSYRGVQLREEELESGGSGSIHFPKRFSIIELLHSDPSKTIPLYVREEGETPCDVQRAFAERFHLPQLAYDISGTVSPDTLIRAEDPGPPPSGVVVRQVGGVTCLAIGQSHALRWVRWLFWLAFPLGAGWLVNKIEPAMAPLAAGMAAGLVVVLLLIGMFMGRGKGGLPRGICIGTDAVWLGRSGDPPDMPIPVQAIRQVRLDRAHGGERSAASVKIVVDGGNRRIEFAAGAFDRRRVEWIRNRLLFLIGRARMADGRSRFGSSEAAMR